MGFGLIKVVGKTMSFMQLNELDLKKRTKDFAILIIKLSVEIPSTTEGKVIKNQLIKSGTSIGANYWEANRSRSKADFKNKIKICESEASETVYL